MKQFQWTVDNSPVERAEVEVFVTKLGDRARQLRQLREMEHEAVVCGVSEGLRHFSRLLKVSVVDPHYIEGDGIAPNGHRYHCHVFQCAGCPLPAGFCTCDYEAPLRWVDKPEFADDASLDHLR